MKLRNNVIFTPGGAILRCIAAYRKQMLSPSGNNTRRHGRWRQKAVHCRLDRNLPQRSRHGIKAIPQADLASDMDRGYYDSRPDHRAAPSETIERMMLHRGVRAAPANTWPSPASATTTSGPVAQEFQRRRTVIELGEPGWLRKACAAPPGVAVHYGGRAADIWWQGMEGKVGRFDHLNIFSITPETLAELAALCERSMQLNATVQDGTLWLSSEKGSVAVTPQRLYGSSER
jgi:uncharacterized protein YaeQ